MILITKHTKQLLLKSNIRFSTTAKHLLPTTTPQQQPATTSSTVSSQPNIFRGNTEIKGSTEDRMATLFGGRIRGDVRVSSSRREVGEPRMIAGVLVPAKPKEPDNCCMSGCVNCVWEQYNDDIKDWRHKRTEAVKAISATEEKWPADFDPPLAKLDIKNIPKELRNEKRKLSKAKKISTASYFPATGKPGAQNILEDNEDGVLLDSDPVEDEEEWKNVPVSFRVFAENEKRIKLAKKRVAAAKAAKAAREKAAQEASV